MDINLRLKGYPEATIYQNSLGGFLVHAVLMVQALFCPLADTSIAPDCDPFIFVLVCLTGTFLLNLSIPLRLSLYRSLLSLFVWKGRSARSRNWSGRRFPTKRESEAIQ